MFNQSNSSFQIWWIVSYVWLNSAKELVSFISNSYIMHRIAWTLISAIFPENFSIYFRHADGRDSLLHCSWFTLGSAALLVIFPLLSKPISRSTVDTAVLSHQMPTRRNLQMWFRAPPCHSCAPAFCCPVLVDCTCLLSDTGSIQTALGSSINFF